MVVIVIKRLLINDNNVGWIIENIVYVYDDDMVAMTIKIVN